MTFVFEPARTSIGDTFAGGEATIVDIFSATYDAFRFTENLVSSGDVMERAIDERNAEVFRETGVKLDNPMRKLLGEAIRDVAMQEQRRFQGGGNEDPRRVLQKGIADWQAQIEEAARRIPDGNIGARLTRSIEGDALRIVRESNELQARLMESRPGLGKWLGVLGGGAAAILRDPLQTTALIYGGGAGAVRTVGGRILAVAAREAFVNGATEAVLQPVVQAWREKAGLDHGLSEAMKNVAFAAAFGGAFGAAGQGAAELAGKFAGRALEVAGDVAATDARVAEPLRRAMAGDLAAAASELPPIRKALPAEARGALDAVEMLDHTDAQRAATTLPQRHDAMVSEAHRAIDEGRPLQFEPDPAQVERVFREVVGEELAATQRPVSLVEFLQAKGGVLEQNGELKAIGAESLTGRRPRKGKADKRLSLDYAREAAEEAGYIGRAGEAQTTTVADLLDAIDRELRGEKVYSRADLDQVEDLAARERDRAGVENRVHEVAQLAGPAVDDAVIGRAARISLEEGIDAGDALDRVYTQMELDAPRDRFVSLDEGWAMGADLQKPREAVVRYGGEDFVAEAHEQALKAVKAKFGEAALRAIDADPEAHMGYLVRDRADGRFDDPMPGWSDAELDAAAAGRGGEPIDEPAFDDPGAIDDEFRLDATDIGEVPDGFTMPGPDGHPVTLAKYMEDIANDAELHSVVKACRA